MSKNYTTKIFMQGITRDTLVFYLSQPFLILSPILKWSIFDKPSRLLL